MPSPLHTQPPVPATPAALGTFPAVSGRNLEGREFSLPSDLGGHLNVVLVAFKREQQADVDTWTPSLKLMADSTRDLRVYEIPALGRGYRLMRGFIDGGMRRGIPDKAVREATITLYIDKTPFRAALQLPDEEAIAVLLVDRAGHIYWRGMGRYSESLGAELAGVVAHVR